jgi:tetratricopeptide (TPR) repeat protein
VAVPADVEAGATLICQFTCGGDSRYPGQNIGRFRVSTFERHPTGQQGVWNAAMQAMPSWEKLGWCYLLEGDVAAGAAALTKAITGETHNAARLNLIELISEQEEVLPALQKTLPDEPAVKAFRLRREAEHFVANDQVGQALNCYEQLAELPGYELDLGATKELYARTMQWERALDGFEKTNDFRRAFMLYQVGRYEDYQEELRKRLADYKEFNGDWRSQSYLVLALLQPVTEELHDAVTELARKQVGKNDWIAGQAMYRLGRFTQWYAELSEDSSVRKKQDPFVVAIDRFANDPSEENRRLLKQIVDIQQERANRQLRDGQLGKDWRGHIVRQSFVLEAERLLEQDDNVKQPSGN